MDFIDFIYIMTNKHTNIYDISKYTNNELYSILDLNNPTDRELEAKIHIFLNKYENNESQDGRKLFKFFNDIYTHLFDLSDQEQEQEQDQSFEGFTNFFQDNIKEGFGVSFSGLNELSQTPTTKIDENNKITYDGIFNNPTNSIKDTIYSKTNPKPKAGTQSNISFDIGTQDTSTIANGSNAVIGYTATNTATTKTVDYIPGNLNPLLKETIKRIISIDSQFRDQSTYPLSTCFTFNLSDTLIDVVSLKLYSIQIPYSWYTINDNFGSNFFYLKGNSPGINDGNSDYKIQIDSGNYTIPSLISTVNTSISNLSNSLNEVDLSNTQMTYNSTSIKSNLNIKIAKYYNDINYYLDFPVKTNPYNNDQTNNNNNSSDISRYKSIPGFLGLMDNISNTSTYNIFSSSFTGNLLNYITGTQKINIYSLNNSIKLILYTPSSITQIPQNYTTPEYSSSTIDPIIITIPMTSNILAISYTNILQIITAINTVFSQTPELIGSTISIDTYNINSIDPSIPQSIINSYTTTTSIQSYKFKINIKLNRQLIKFTENMKAIIQLPNETTIWTTNTSLFKFDTSNNELNNIISNVDTPTTTLEITNSPYIYLKCNKEYYGNNGITHYDSGTITYDMSFNPTITKPLLGNVFINQDITGNTFNINPLSSNYYVKGTTYTLVGDEYILINKIQNITGNVNVIGANINIHGSTYDIIGNTDLSKPAIIRGPIQITQGNTDLYSSSGNSYIVNSLNPLNIFETTTTENININGNLKITNQNQRNYGNINIINLNGNIIADSTEPYSFIGNTKIWGNVQTMGLSQTQNMTGNITGTDYNIIGNSFITNTQYTGNIQIITGNVIMNSSQPYTIYGNSEILTNSFKLYGNTYISDNLNLTGNVWINSPDSLTVKGVDYEIYENDTQITDDDNDNYSKTTSGNLKIRGNNYQLIRTSNYYIFGQPYIVVKGNAHIYSGNAQISTDNSYIISGTNYLLDGNIRIANQTNLINGNIKIQSSNQYIINGQPSYNLIGNTYNISGNTIITGNVTINTPGNINIDGQQYKLVGNANINGPVNIIYGNVKINSSTQYNVSGESYQINGNTNIEGNIFITVGNLQIQSNNPYVISGNNYDTNGQGQTYNGNSYILSGNSIIHGNNYNVYGNINIYQDNSLNDYIIGNITNSNYLLEDYISEINTKIQVWNGEMNSSGSASMSINADSKSRLIFDIVNTITTENYSIDLSKSFLGTTNTTTTKGVIKFTDILDLTTVAIVNNTATYTSSFQTQSSYIISDDEIITINSIGTKNKFAKPITLKIQPGTYNTIATLQNAINSIFNTVTYGIDFSKSSLILEYAPNNKINCTLIIQITTKITEADYSLYFYDNDLSNSSIQYINMPKYYGYIKSKWIDSTWNSILKFESQKYDLIQSTPIYAEIIGSQEIFGNLIKLDTSNNYFYIKPIIDPSGGVYTVTLNSDGIGYNDIRIDTNLTGSFSKESLKNAINYAFTNNPLTAGSSINFIIANTLQYTKLRLNINKIFKTSDFILDFYDPVSFVTCNVGVSGKSSIRNTTWDSTLGWILGFRNLTIYDLIPEYQQGQDPNTSYYNEYVKTPYSYNNETNLVSIKGDTCISIYLYNYFMIILDDFVQNHLNDGLVTITQSDNDIALPSYANRTTLRCDPTTNKPISTSVITNYNNLTSKQLYSANQILNTQTKQKSHSSGPFAQDIFGLIPVKTTGMTQGQVYIEFGGTLQLQERTYFGPVNIRRMSIKLMNDKGDIVDLNGSNWSFSLICEQLYTRSK